MAQKCSSAVVEVILESILKKGVRPTEAMKHCSRLSSNTTSSAKNVRIGRWESRDLTLLMPDSTSLPSSNQGLW
jgi:hypothetical protein